LHAVDVNTTQKEHNFKNVTMQSSPAPLLQQLLLHHTCQLLPVSEGDLHCGPLLMQHVRPAVAAATNTGTKTPRHHLDNIMN
jgi:hypothetical protein